MASDARPRDLELAIGVPLLGAVLLAAAYEIGPRQTDAYLGPALSTPRWFALTLMALALGGGVFAGRRWCARSRGRARLVLGLVAALSVTCSGSGALWFWAFGTPPVMPVVACALPLCAGFLAGAALGALQHATALSYRELSGVRVLLSPLALSSAVALTLGASIALSYLGLWRAAAALGGSLAVLGLLAPRFFEYTSDLRPPRSRACLAALALATASFAAAQAFVPARLLSRYLPELVWANEDDDTVVISAQNTFELFEAQQLRVTSADDYRLAELAVHPLLSGLRPRGRVLVLGPAGGFLEREVLRYRNVAELVSLSERERGAFSRSIWARRAPDSRERYVVAELIPWLEQHPEPFDAILVSLPLPVTPNEGKYYTRYFFELLAARLSPRGAIALQGVARGAMPETHASLRASLLAAGLDARSYEAPLPLLGAVSFFTATRGADHSHEPGPLPAGLRYLDEAALRRIWVRGKEADGVGPVSTLAHQHAVVLWHLEQEKLGN